jgi:predicted Mrr-cat superfamily restriction endonuclease
MPKPEHAWMVRADNDNELADIVQQEKVIAIGCQGMGALSDPETREDFKQYYRETYPEDSEGQLAVNVGQVCRFVRKIQDGDYLLTYIFLLEHYEDLDPEYKAQVSLGKI